MSTRSLALLGGLLGLLLGAACARGPSPSRSPSPGADVLPPPEALVEVGVPGVAPEIAEGTYFVAGIVESISAPTDRPSGVVDVVISAGEATAACQLGVQAPDAGGPLRVGVDGTRARGLRLYLDRAEAPPVAVGDHVCGLVDRRRLPPFYTRVEAVLVDAEGIVRFASSPSSALVIPGWSFVRGGVIGSRRVDGGVARWRVVEVEHGGSRARVDLDAWPILEAEGQRYRIFALAYEKEGRLVPEEAPWINDFAILWIGRSGAAR
ncbi:MAG: hypothetical protein H6711_16210 [Myxococcales bacterium]|nr:hypothetical protein [Myxococcales bacterium]